MEGPPRKRRACSPNDRDTTASEDAPCPRSMPVPPGPVPFETPDYGDAASYPPLPAQAFAGPMQPKPTRFASKIPVPSAASSSASFLAAPAAPIAHVKVTMPRPEDIITPSGTIPLWRARKLVYSGLSTGNGTEIPEKGPSALMDSTPLGHEDNPFCFAELQAPDRMADETPTYTSIPQVPPPVWAGRRKRNRSNSPASSPPPLPMPPRPFDIASAVDGDDETLRPTALDSLPSFAMSIGSSQESVMPTFPLPETRIAFDDKGKFPSDLADASTSTMTLAPPVTHPPQPKPPRAAVANQDDFDKGYLQALPVAGSTSSSIENSPNRAADVAAATAMAPRRPRTTSLLRNGIFPPNFEASYDDRIYYEEDEDDDNNNNVGENGGPRPMRIDEDDFALRERFDDEYIPQASYGNASEYSGFEEEEEEEEEEEYHPAPRFRDDSMFFRLCGPLDGEEQNLVDQIMNLIDQPPTGKVPERVPAVLPFGFDGAYKLDENLVKYLLASAWKTVIFNIN
ncbi:hypothetical protein HDU96_009308 [Phlyctochytrium bullatum]|nr:hypothetical protein HDU96_009308 [Phlyctochytrium bullatum]